MCDNITMLPTTGDKWFKLSMVFNFGHILNFFTKNLGSWKCMELKTMLHEIPVQRLSLKYFRVLTFTHLP